MIDLKKLFKFNKIGRWLLLLGILVIPVVGSAETRTVFFETMADAYLAVSVFVGITLLIFYGLETWLKLDTEKLLKKHKKYQVPIAAFLGVLPGCGGAIMVMTQYSLGRLGFGSVVAVLTSTMGDAAFLLLAQRPDKALELFAISLVVGIISGYIVDKTHHYDFMRPKQDASQYEPGEYFTYDKVKYLWVGLLIPGFIIGLLGAFQAADFLGDFALYFGVVGAILSLLMWFVNPSAGSTKSNAFQCSNFKEVWDKVTADTSFVTVWVVLAFLIFEMGILWTGFDFAGLFAGIFWVMPLIGVLVGFLPGCGPQILMTTMYLQGLVPFSVQVANGISNDGDALFPAIAIAPKASIVATLYTAIPALIVGYGYMFLFE